MTFEPRMWTGFIVESAGLTRIETDPGSYVAFAASPVINVKHRPDAELSELTELTERTELAELTVLIALTRYSLTAIVQRSSNDRQFCDPELVLLFCYYFADHGFRPHLR